MKARLRAQAAVRSQPSFCSLFQLMSQWHVKGCPGNPLTPPPTHTPNPSTHPNPSVCMHTHTHTDQTMRKSDCCHHFTSFFLYLFRVAHASFPYPPDLSPLSHQRLFSVSLLLCWVPHLSLPPETHTHISITFSGLEQRLAIQPLKPTRGLEMELLCEYTSLLVVVYTRTHKGV